MRKRIFAHLLLTALLTLSLLMSSCRGQRKQEETQTNPSSVEMTTEDAIDFP